MQDTDYPEHLDKIDKRDLCLLLSYYTHEPYYALMMREVVDVDDGFLEWIRLRQSGVPVAKIVGHKEFYGLDFVTNSHTLDPRPETEMMIDTMRKLISLDDDLDILDLGCGTGCIGVTALTLYKNAHCDFCDLCPKALETARKNAERHGVCDRSTFVLSDWFEKIDPSKKYDVILCNPPYVASDYPLDHDTLHDPHLALFGGHDGLVCYRAIIRDIHKYCKRLVIFEIGYDQGRSVIGLLEASMIPCKHIAVRKDYGGHDRVVVCEL